MSNNKLQHTFYFIRFPLYAGGTHLSNLMRLSVTMDHGIHNLNKDEFALFIEENYRNDAKTIAHLPRHHVIHDGPAWRQCLDNLDFSYAASTHIGHAASFDWVREILDTLPIKKFILLTFNDPESVHILRRREMYLAKTDTLRNPYYVKEIAHFYNRQFDSKIPSDVNLTIEINELFNDNIQPVLEKITEKYGLEFPLDKCEVLHSIWLNKFKQLQY